LTTTSGLYAAAHLKNLQDPKMSYPLLANDILPPLAKGYFFVGMIATIMATLNSNIFISATTFGKDILSKFLKIDDKENKYSKISILITCILSLIIAVLIPSVVQIWFTIGSLVIPALLLGVVTAYSDKLKISNSGIFLAMLVSFFISLGSFILGYIYRNESGNPVYFFGIEPMYPGLFAGILFYFSFLIYKKIKK
jgi:SSS family solute:Na+ symporter